MCDDHHDDRSEYSREAVVGVLGYQSPGLDGGSEETVQHTADETGRHGIYHVDIQGHVDHKPSDQ